ncbi:MAG: serine hydrolase, partial [Proteobacteria bacterium]|nr:serine hydrolase [Pseudomonadota bacterium]
MSRAGRLAYARGIGHADRGRTRPVPPDALMRIASLSKPLTAAAVQTLAARGRLKATDRVLNRVAPPGVVPQDRRWREITVAHLLQHRGGWDSGKSFDPLFRIDEIEKVLRLARPARPADLVRYMLGKPLQFDPGGASVYANFGYTVLGRVIEKVSGTSYINFLRQQVLGPHDIHDVLLGRSTQGTRYAREVEYMNGAAPGFRVEAADAAGGLVASAPALAAFLRHYWIDGRARKPGVQGNWTFFGSLPGTSAVMRQLPGGTDYVVLLNGRRDQAFKQDALAFGRA